MKWDWRIALPFLIGAGLAVVNALLDYLGTIHLSGPYGPAAFLVATALGDYIRAQLRIAQAKKDQLPPSTMRSL